MTDQKTDPPPPAAKDSDALPPTPLARLAALAKEKMGPEPDRAGPAATRTMAAIVRDLKGMPEILVTRDSTHRIKLARKGKIGALAVEYHPSIRAMSLEAIGFSTDVDPVEKKMHRYTFFPDRGPNGEWLRLDDNGELFADVQQTLLRLYPEIQGA